MLMNVKMTTIVGILTFMIMINYMLSSVEHENLFIIFGPGLRLYLSHLLIDDTDMPHWQTF